jgi:hypothetical protein
VPKKAVTKNKYERKSKRSPKKRTDAATAFRAPEQAPGQPKSHEAFDAFEKQRESAAWWTDYTELRNEGFTWRIAVYIAWASSPLQRRWPSTLKELATTVLGLKSEKVIFKWRKMNPEIDQRVQAFRAEPLLRYRADVLHALVDVASTHDPSSHADRKLYLEMIGMYTPKAQTVLTGANDGPVGVSVSHDELDAAIEQELERVAATGKIETAEPVAEDVHATGQRAEVAGHESAGSADRGTGGDGQEPGLPGET